MSVQSFAATLRRDHEALWDAVVEHPFIQGIGDGSLSKARYRFYLEQDYFYLVELSRVLALAAARSTELSQMRQLADLLQLTHTVEIDGLCASCAELGIDVNGLGRVVPGLVTTAYTDALVRTCYEGSVGDIVAALLPCETGYVEIASRLRDAGAAPPQRRYRAWIEAYSAPEMQELAANFVLWCDTCAERGSSAERTRWATLYRKSLRYELLFFDAAWGRSAWPEVVPM